MAFKASCTIAQYEVIKLLCLPTEVNLPEVVPATSKTCRMGHLYPRKELTAHFRVIPASLAAIRASRAMQRSCPPMDTHTRTLISLKYKYWWWWIFFASTSNYICTGVCFCNVHLLSSVLVWVILVLSSLLMQ